MLTKVFLCFIIIITNKSNKYKIIKSEIVFNVFAEAYNFKKQEDKL